MSRWEGIREQEVAEAALMASLADETPEGRSIVALARQKYGLQTNDASRPGRK